MTTELNLEFQTEGTDFLKSHSRALLGDDPGLGKTKQALQAAHGRTLVLGPAMLEGTWAQERKLWAPDLDMTFCSYPSLPMMNPDWVSGQKNAKGRNPEPKFIPRPKAEFRGPWDCIILDEAHNVKNRKAIWTGATERLDAPNIWMLTGTPIPNWGHELFILCRILHPTEAGPGKEYGSYWRWVEKWFQVEILAHARLRPGQEPPRKIGKLIGCATSGCGAPRGQTCEHWHDFYVGNDLDSMMLRRTREDKLPGLPPILGFPEGGTMYDVPPLEVDMVPAQRKAYQSMKKDYYALLEETGKEVMAFSGGAKTVKLAKLCTGLEIEDPEAHGSGKLDAIEQLLIDRAGTPVVVFTQFKETARQVALICDKIGSSSGVIMGGIPQKERDATKDAFQAGQIDVLIGTIATIREGLTLTRADTCIFVELTWTPTRNDQALRRIHRIGQTRPVTLIRLETKNSLDSKMIRVLQEKSDEQVKALTAGEFAELL
jgi:SNF2 family DNA or RNA helicase